MELIQIFKLLLNLRLNANRLAIYDRRDRDLIAFMLQNSNMSSAQIFQDLWVLFETGSKRNGYFVEFGACDGCLFSNTLMLEKAFGWNGIVAEPCRKWQHALQRNRSCYITDKCVYSESGLTLEFNETTDPELSTIEQFTSLDMHAEARKDGTRYSVESISLLDLLIAAKAPAEIDYISVDTEGSEYDILEKFDFDRYKIKLMSVEHAYTPDKRQQVYELLRDKGFRRVFHAFSEFDDWYVREA